MISSLLTATVAARDEHVHMWGDGGWGWLTAHAPFRVQMAAIVRV